MPLLCGWCKLGWLYIVCWWLLMHNNVPSTEITEQWVASWRITKDFQPKSQTFQTKNNTLPSVVSGACCTVGETSSLECVGFITKSSKFSCVLNEAKSFVKSSITSSFDKFSVLFNRSDMFAWYNTNLFEYFLQFSEANYKNLWKLMLKTSPLETSFYNLQKCHDHAWLSKFDRLNTFRYTIFWRMRSTIIAIFSMNFNLYIT